MKILRIAVKIILPIVVICIGFYVMKYLEENRKPPEKKETAYTGVLVETVTPVKGVYQIKVFGTGTVNPKQKITVVPQVSGKVVDVSDKFIAGGVFREGEKFFSIEDVDYKSALAEAESRLAKSELDLEIERTRGDIAYKDWQSVSKELLVTSTPLILRKPYLKEAEAAFLAAEAAVRKTEADLDRTILRAPFNCVVKDENIDKGQYIVKNIAVAEVFGTDVAEIVVPLQLNELKWIKIPAYGSDSVGSDVSVEKYVDGKRFEWRGCVVRLLGDVDSKGRMARVVVEVLDPFNKNDSLANSKIKLFDNMFVNVVIHGDLVEDLFTIPSGAIRADSTVWIMGDDSKLDIKKVDIFRMEKQQVVIKSGISDKDRIVVTDISGAALGMLLRTSDQDRRSMENNLE